jgi:AMMECR1 domain-containing protein
VRHALPRSLRPAFFVLLALLAICAPAGAGPAPELEPYRALARDHAACESLLAIARGGLAAALEGRAPAAAGATLVWPGSVRPLYVTLARGRATRACVGSDVPPGGALAEALSRLGGELATSDRRHPPLRAEELDTLRLVIAFASDPEPVRDPMTIDPVREGLKIETERGTLAFLPGEARTIAWALAEARRVGLLAGRTAAARFSRFSVVVLQGPALSRGVRSRAQEP